LRFVLRIRSYVLVNQFKIIVFEETARIDLYVNVEMICTFSEL